jgi:diphosphomevalonate decarboxylase
MTTEKSLKKRKIESSKEITCSSPVNIAVIKYWGKRKPLDLLLPTNSSLSVTLNQDDLKTTTSIRISSEGEDDCMILNGKMESINHPRLQNVIIGLRGVRKDMEAKDSTLQKYSEWKLTIVSVNNFPTAAGLASSASGYACLAFALAKLYELPMSDSDISMFARIGSGSACRSLMGGFVKWEMGEELDGSDSLAHQVAPASHWPEMEALILVVSDAQKDIGSTVGMQESVLTSTLFTERVCHVVPERMKQMEHAILNRDFDTFAELTMKDSNQFHAICLDTFPPIFYMNDVSRAIVRVVTAYNSFFTKVNEETGKITGYRVAYTFDAGPNAVLYAQKDHIQDIFDLVNLIFPKDISDNCIDEYYGKAKNMLKQNASKGETAKVISSLGLQPQPKDSLRRIIWTSIGDGPRILTSNPGDKLSLISPDVHLISNKAEI